MMNFEKIMHLAESIHLEEVTRREERILGFRV